MLSRFAGASRELDGALLVNPYDKESVSQAIRHALNMSQNERQYRYSSMIKHLQENDINHWCANYLGELRCA